MRIIAAFAGTGKSFLAKMFPDKYIDFVCMPYKYYLPDNFDENESESRKADSSNEMCECYPENYVAAIKQNLAETDKILIIPSDSWVLEWLKIEEIPYLLCYPENTQESKDEYEKRYIQRGNSERFIEIFIGGWEYFFRHLEHDTYGKPIIMKPNEFLSDVV